MRSGSRRAATSSHDKGPGHWTGWGCGTGAAATALNTRSTRSTRSIVGRTVRSLHDRRGSAELLVGRASTVLGQSVQARHCVGRPRLWWKTPCAHCQEAASGKRGIWVAHVRSPAVCQTRPRRTLMGLGDLALERRDVGGSRCRVALEPKRSVEMPIWPRSPLRRRCGNCRWTWFSMSIGRALLSTRSCGPVARTRKPL